MLLPDQLLLLISCRIFFPVYFHLSMHKKAWGKSFEVRSSITCGNGKTKYVYFFLKTTLYFKSYFILYGMHWVSKCWDVLCSESGRLSRRGEAVPVEVSWGFLTSHILPFTMWVLCEGGRGKRGSLGTSPISFIFNSNELFSVGFFPIRMHCCQLWRSTCRLFHSGWKPDKSSATLTVLSNHTNTH